MKRAPVFSKVVGLRRNIIFWRKELFDNLKKENLATWFQKCMEETKQAYALPTYDPEFYDVGNLVCVDIGANVGAFCLSVNARYGLKIPPFKHLFAFEPSEDNCQVFNEIMKDNKHLIGANVGLYQNAVYSHSGMQLNMYAAQDTLCSGDIYVSEKTEDSFDMKQTCESLSLKDLMSDLQIERINYLKMDAEGAEHKIFKTFKDHDKIDVLAIEIHNDRKQLIEELSEYYIFADIWQHNIDPDLRPPILTAAAIEDPIEDMDFLINRCPPNFLCINKNSKGLTF